MPQNKGPRVKRIGSATKKNLQTQIMSGSDVIMHTGTLYNDPRDRMRAEEIALEALAKNDLHDPLFRHLMYNYCAENYDIQLEFLINGTKKLSER